MLKVLLYISTITHEQTDVSMGLRGDRRITETFFRNSSNDVRRPIAPEPTTNTLDAGMMRQFYDRIVVVMMIQHFVTFGEF